MKEMQVLRVTSSTFFDLVKDKLQGDEWRSREDYVEHLKYQFINSPANFFIIAAIEHDEIVGFIIAIVLPPTPYTWITQAYAKPGLDLSIADEGLAHIAAWTRALGLSSVRGETKREANALFRRWGFQEVAKVVEFKVPEGDFKGFLNLTHDELIGSTEVQDGRRLESETSVNVESLATGGESEVTAVADGEPREGGSAQESGLP